jgi:protein SCO1/2
MNERTLRIAVATLAMSGFGMMVSACRPAGESAKAAGSAEAAEADGKRHPITGTVVSVLRERGSLLVDHDEIPGYMPRMTMEFSVTAGDLALARDGAALRATLVEGKTGEFRLEGVWWETPESALAVKKAAASLREETGIRGRGAYREVGENLPDFALYNQNGEVAQAARWSGKQVMLNFIFTRCPIATMCPASTMRMMETQRLAKEAAVANIEFVSITLDPEYDTPGVLREYAEARGIDTGNFSFLTGPEGAIKDLLKQFGILTEMDGPILKHTLATLLINEQGRIVWRADGSSWEPKEFVEKMK